MTKKTKKSKSEDEWSEEPVQIIPSAQKQEHKTETRVFERNIQESFCVQPGCKFEGKHAVQNVCHTFTTMTGSTDWSYIDNVMKAGDEYVSNIRKNCKGKSTKEYIRRLESEMSCAWMNTMVGLDELVRLRGQVAILMSDTAKKQRQRSKRRKPTALEKNYHSLPRTKKKAK